MAFKGVTIPAVALLGSLAAFSVPASAQGYLGGAELKALITGNTIHAQNLASKLFQRAHYEPSGQFTVLRDDAVQFSGLWSIRPDGSLCLIVNVEECGRIEKNADGSYTRIVGGTPAFKWMKVTPGKDF